LTVAGDGVSAFALSLSFPFNKSNYTNVTNGNKFKINPTDNITYLYIGSMQD